MLLCMLTGTAVAASAAEAASQSGIEASIATDKDSYSSGEDINVTIIVKNTNTYDVNDVSVTLELPEGLKLKSGELNVSGIDIPAGETYTKDVIAIKEAPAADTDDSSTPEETPAASDTTAPEETPEASDTTAPEETTTVPDSSAPADEGKDNDNPPTGVSLNVLPYIIILAVSGAVIFITIKQRKKAAKILSLVLCVAIASSIVPIDSFAAETDEDTFNITVEKTITVDGDEYVLKSNINLSNSQEVVLSNFNADEIYFICGEESTITFTVDAIGNPDEIKLCKNENEPVGLMHDDGLNGDAIANDDIYTYSCTISSEVEAEDKYYAFINDTQKSEFITIRFFDAINIGDYDTFVSVYDKIKDIEKLYMDSDGKVHETNIEPCLLAVEEYAKDLKNQGIVYRYELYIQEEKLVSITIKLESGLEIVFVPNNGEKLSSGKQLAIMSQIKSYVPAEHQRGAEDLLNYSVEGITKLGDSHIWIKDEAVTLDIFDKMGPNQVILWSGHGVPTKQSTYLEVQESYDKIRFWIYDPVYFVDLAFIQSKMCITSDGFLAVNYKYLKDNLPDLTGSFIYLLSCTSGDDSNLCNTFIDKGAVSLVAVHNSINAYYGVVMQAVLGALLTEINPETNNYYTVDEAMSMCKEEYGPDDGAGAYPFVYQGGTLKGSYRLANVSAGTLSGKICKASDRSTAISGATINVYKDNNLYTTKTADATGNYSINLPAGQYYIEITAEGYIDFHSYATVTEGENTYMETFLMVEGSEGETGIASGRVVDSIIGTGVDGVTLTVRKDWNNMNEDAETVSTVTTDSNGNYSVELPLGNYTVIASKDGYIKSSFNIIVQSGTTDNQNGTITPEISGDEFLITLTWGENPRDLDSHVEGTLANGDPFHVYYEHMSEYDGDIQICNLDYDDTTSYGPEHITLKVDNNKPYYYYIYKYAGEGTVANSEAKITVYKGNNLIAEYNVPTNLGDDDYWNVFAIKDGRLIVKNTITPYADTTYAN